MCSAKWMQADVRTDVATELTLLRTYTLFSQCCAMYSDLESVHLDNKSPYQLYCFLSSLPTAGWLQQRPITVLCVFPKWSAWWKGVLDPFSGKWNRSSVDFQLCHHKMVNLTWKKTKKQNKDDLCVLYSLASVLSVVLNAFNSETIQKQCFQQEAFFCFILDGNYCLSQ